MTPVTFTFMTDIIINSCVGVPTPDHRLEVILTETCVAVSDQCDYECPVFSLNKGVPLDQSTGTCSCFMDGAKMLHFIRSNTAEYVPEKRKKKHTEIVNPEDIKRLTRFKLLIIKKIMEKYKEAPDNLKIFTCKKPLTPQRFVGIVEDFGVNTIPKYKEALVKVVVAIEMWNFKRPMVDANATIRNWMLRDLGVESIEDLNIPYKTIHVSTEEELLKETKKLKERNNEN